jgi:uncharacterized protein (DUF433 family)
MNTRTDIARHYLTLARNDVTTASQVLAQRIQLAHQYGLTDNDIQQVLRGD